MKPLSSLPTVLLTVSCLLLAPHAFGAEEGIACLGNGEMAVYEERSDIIQLFGPPYSSPSALQLTLASPLMVASQREPGTAVWKHRLQERSGKEAGSLVDFVAAGLPAFVREIENSDTLRFRLTLSPGTEIIDNTPRFRQEGASHALLLTSPAGSYAYLYYPTLWANSYQWIAEGNLRVTPASDRRSWEVVCAPGKSVLRIVSGRDYPQCVTNTRHALAEGPGRLLEQTRTWWGAFTARRTDFARTLPASVPQRERLLQAIDDVAVLIKAQQGTEGGVLAGYRYHLGYVRDQYGVSRGLLAMGYTEEARAILQFYWEIWQRKGMIRNAQGIGLDAFHVHENDDVEITGYLIIQAFDYLRASGDKAYLRTIFPMLAWAWDAQVGSLHLGMLPFNGDETYIAGGILPRTTLLDGSAEATLLFLTGGQELVRWAEQEKLWPAGKIAETKQVLAEVSGQYPENFLREGRLMTNNPARREGLAFPAFRHGVCESCITVEWTERTPNNRYLCAACLPTKTLPDRTDEVFYLQSVSLTPWYVHSGVLPDPLVEGFVREIARGYAATGRFPSRPDAKRTVGYDYGLLLYSLVRMDHPLRERVYGQMLDVLDATGAWVEYYEDGVPSGTLCRPWESAINIEAAIAFAQGYK